MPSQFSDDYSKVFDLDRGHPSAWFGQTPQWYAGDETSQAGYYLGNGEGGIQGERIDPYRDTNYRDLKNAGLWSQDSPAVQSLVYGRGYDFNPNFNYPGGAAGSPEAIAYNLNGLMPSHPHNRATSGEWQDAFGVVRPELQQGTLDNLRRLGTTLQGQAQVNAKQSFLNQYIEPLINPITIGAGLLGAPLVGSLGAAGAGATIGGVGGALATDSLRGGLTGALTGALGGGLGAPLAESLGGGATGAIGSGAILAGGSAALSGGDIERAALTGGLMSGGRGLVTGFDQPAPGPQPSEAPPGAQPEEPTQTAGGLEQYASAAPGAFTPGPAGTMLDAPTSEAQPSPVSDQSLEQRALSPDPSVADSQPNAQTMDSGDPHMWDWLDQIIGGGGPDSGAENMFAAEPQYGDQPFVGDLPIDPQAGDYSGDSQFVGDLPTDPQAGTSTNPFQKILGGLSSANDWMKNNKLITSLLLGAGAGGLQMYQASRQAKTNAAAKADAQARQAQRQAQMDNPAPFGAMSGPGLRLGQRIDQPMNAQQLRNYGAGPEMRYFSAEGGLPTDGRMGAFDSLMGGEGGGQDDTVPAMLSPTEYVLDADIVAALGDGNPDEGAKRLDQWRENIRAHKRSAPVSKIPPKAKRPEQYMRRAA